MRVRTYIRESFLTVLVKLQLANNTMAIIQKLSANMTFLSLQLNK
jgi:hypothetical protein